MMYTRLYHLFEYHLIGLYSEDDIQELDSRQSIEFLKNNKSAFRKIIASDTYLVFSIKKNN